MNQASIRRFIFTLITGYLAIFGVQQIPYEFPNQWAVLIPVLIVVYIITVWMAGVCFKDDEAPKKTTKKFTPPTEEKTDDLFDLLADRLANELPHKRQTN